MLLKQNEMALPLWIEGGPGDATLSCVQIRQELRFWRGNGELQTRGRSGITLHRQEIHAKGRRFFAIDPLVDVLAENGSLVDVGATLEAIDVQRSDLPVFGERRA